MIIYFNILYISKYKILSKNLTLKICNLKNRAMLQIQPNSPESQSIQYFQLLVWNFFLDGNNWS